LTKITTISAEKNYYNIGFHEKHQFSAENWRNSPKTAIIAFVFLKNSKYFTENGDHGTPGTVDLVPKLLLFLNKKVSENV
jgi:hypothetical protein